VCVGACVRVCICTELERAGACCPAATGLRTFTRRVTCNSAQCILSALPFCHLHMVFSSKPDGQANLVGEEELLFYF
jgi:hypothetical protein